MKQINQIITFKNTKIRRHWDDKKELWYFSVVDIIATLTDSINPTDYLKKLRKRDFELGNYIGTNCPHVEMTTETGKKRKTLAANIEQKTNRKVVSPSNFKFLGGEKIKELE